jgi:RNA 2',3'-cyclic 3'-phosphodiesterase
VAAGFPPEVRLAVAAQLDRRILPGVRVPAENLHFTLRFIGDLDAVGFDRLLAGLDETTMPDPFRVALGGLGAFPQPRQAAVLWIGVTAGVEALEDLHLAVENACEVAGLGREDRPFRPHVTVSRMRPPEDVRGVIASTPPLDMRSSIDEIVVLRSHLGGGSPRYEPLERFPL